MRKLTNEFSNISNNNELKFSECKLVDPKTIRLPNGDYYSLSNSSADKVAKLINFNDYKFSSKLFKLSQESWTNLVSSQLVQSEVMEEANSTKLFTFNKVVYNLYTDDTDLSMLFNFINDIDRDKYDMYYEITEKSGALHVLVINNESNIGFLLNYYPLDNWISVYSSCISDNILYVFGVPQYSLKYESEEVSPLLDLESIINDSEATCSMTDSLKQQLDKSYVSLNELVRIVKDTYRVKLASNRTDYSKLVNIDNYNDEELNMFNKIIKIVYDNPELVTRLNTNYLRRSIKFTDITYNDILKLMTEMVMSDKLGVVTLSDVTYNLVKGSLDCIRLAGEDLYKENN